MEELTILAIITTIFVLIGGFLPYVNQAFDQPANDIDFDSFEDGIQSDIADNINAGDVAKSIISMFFWSFGALPFWLDLMFIVLRIVLVATIVKLLPFT